MRWDPPLSEPCRWAESKQTGHVCVTLSLMHLKHPGRTFLVVQWLRLHIPNTGGPGLMPGQEELGPTCHN